MRELLFRTLIVYGCGFSLVFLCNFVRYVRCAYYEARYLKNLGEHDMLKNAKIRPGVLSLCRKADLCLPCGDTSDFLAHERYAAEVQRMFANAEGVFAYRAMCSIGWPLTAFEALVSFALARRTKSKLISCILNLMGILGSYVVCRLCDASGFGDRVDDFAEMLFAWVRALF